MPCESPPLVSTPIICDLDPFPPETGLFLFWSILRGLGAGQTETGVSGEETGEESQSKGAFLQMEREADASPSLLEDLLLARASLGSNPGFSVSLDRTVTHSIQ